MSYRNTVKKEILNNLDIIVDSICSSEKNVDFSKLSKLELEGIANFIKETIKSQEKKRLDMFLGKKAKPKSLVTKSGTVKKYVEINVDEICRKIKVGDSVFTHLYKYRFHKNTVFADLPDGIKQILAVYKDTLDLTEENDSERLRYAQKWLAGIGLVGIIRFKGLANEPYLLENDVQKLLKKFLKNLENVYNCLNGKSVMIDIKMNGLQLWKTTYNQNLQFIHKEVE
jgi:hypothetical protein